MEAGSGQTTFSIGDPVLVVTDRPLAGWVTGVGDIPHVGAIDFTPQSFQGQKGWVSATRGPASCGDPIAYEVVFRLQGTPRPVVIHQRGEERVVLPEERQVDRGRGHLMDVKPEELAPEPTLEGTYDELMNEMYAAGEFDLDPTAVVSLAEDLLDARQASLQPEAYLARRRGIFPRMPEEMLQEYLVSGQEQWQRFQEEGWSSVHSYVAAYIAHADASRLDWTPILAAIELAEQGDWSSFEVLLEDLYARGSEAMFDTIRRDPGVPTTACFDCDAILPVAETWVNKKGLALCGSCFQKREAKGRARRRRQPFARE